MPIKAFDKINRKWIVLIGSLSVILILAFSGPGEKYFEVARNLDIFASLFKEVNGYYVDEVDPKNLVAIGITAITESLDPYTVYIPEEEAADFRIITTGKYAGIGIMVARINGQIAVTMVEEKYPAFKAGIKIGDRIIEVDGHSLATTMHEEISRLLKGEIDKEVKVKVERYGEPQPIEFRLKRQNIKIANVHYSGMLDSQTGYIRLSDFTNDAGKEVIAALDSLKKLGASSLILDLRGNLGGLLNEAIAVCNVFIEKGKEVVSTRGQVPDWNRSHATLGAPVDKDIPIAILIDNRSASAAEIVAGVIQDYDRGILVGNKSFGKGLVQTTRSLPYNAQLKITTAKYYIPSGRCIQAIDYANRNEEGFVDKIPDSLKVAFKTANGRTVYDGGGIDPDFETGKQILAAITNELLNKGLIFDYATEYYYHHTQITPLDKFELTDKDYNDFVKWVQSKDFEYNTRVEMELKHIEETASNEKYYGALKERISSLRKELEERKRNDFDIFKEEIKNLLAMEIVSRYYFQRGQLRYMVRDDAVIKRATHLLQDQTQYNKALQARK
jgi:carboxyl-terminal processing protease